MAVPAFFCAKSASACGFVGHPRERDTIQAPPGAVLGPVCGPGIQGRRPPTGGRAGPPDCPAPPLGLGRCGADGLRRGVCPTWTPARSGTGWASNPWVFCPGFSADWGCNFSVFHLAVYCAPACCVSWVKKYFAAVSIGKGGPLRSQEGTKVPP